MPAQDLVGTSAQRNRKRCLMIGTTIDQYKILSRIGGGGMGEVYRALDLELQRDVAIKCVRPELADLEEVTKRFRNEARTLAKLSHLNIATVYRFFTNEDRLFLVMEYIDGIQFSGKGADGGRLSYKDAVSMVRDALHGLGYAHENGVVHRDIKPGNLMLDQRGIVKVLDFGIAHLIGGTRMTRAGSMVGTPAYMAPEQILGKQVDQRTDLYSLGIVLYELLAGQLPYQGDSEFELMRSHLEKEPPHLRDITNLEIPLKLQETVERALHKEKEDRFQSAVEFDAALADVVESESERESERAKGNERRSKTTVLPAPNQGMADLMRPVATEIKRRLRPQQIAVGAGVAALMLIGVWAAFSPSTPDPVPQSPVSTQWPNQGQVSGGLPIGGQPSTLAGTDNSSLADPTMIGMGQPLGQQMGQPATQPMGPVTLADGTVINPAPNSMSAPMAGDTSTLPTQQSTQSPGVSPQQNSSAPARAVPPPSQTARTQQPSAQRSPEVQRVRPQTPSPTSSSVKINVMKVSVHEKQGKGRFSRDAGYNGAFTVVVAPGGSRNITVEEVVEVRRDGELVKREVVNTAARTPGTFKSKQRIPQMKSLDVGTYDVQLLLVVSGRTAGSHKWRVNVVD